MEATDNKSDLPSAALRGLSEAEAQRAIAYQEQQQQKLESSKIRINAKGAGRKPILTPEEEICLCLFYLRQMPTFEIDANSV